MMTFLLRLIHVAFNTFLCYLNKSKTYDALHAPKKKQQQQHIKDKNH
jgi:hypothetical protein